MANVNRTYKDDLFRMIFSGKKDLLELYNAINGSHYDRTEDLTVTTIEDVLFMGMKNDTSFLIGQYLNLYEAQSTWCPNMPLRGLFYFSRLYQGYIKERQLDLYSQKRLELPAPRYIVFYNGSRKIPDRTELRLSDSFFPGAKASPCLECTAVVLNINYGHNQQILKSSRKLYEYAYLVNEVRQGLNQGLKLEAAVDRAVDECINHDILKGFLLKHREEVRELILSEYDEELHIKSEKQISFEEGKAEGIAEGKAKGIAEGIAEGKAKGIAEGKIEENIENILSLLYDLSSIPPELEKRIRSETDYTILRTWLKLAARAATIQAFMDQI